MMNRIYMPLRLKQSSVVSYPPKAANKNSIINFFLGLVTRCTISHVSPITSC